MDRLFLEAFFVIPFIYFTAFVLPSFCPRVGHPDGYEQFGTLLGVVSLEHVEEEQVLST